MGMPGSDMSKNLLFDGREWDPVSPVWRARVGLPSVPARMTQHLFNPMSRRRFLSPGSISRRIPSMLGKALRTPKYLNWTRRDTHVED